MSLNLITPSPIPALSTDGLLKLISDPLAASKLWEQYKQARADYEAQRAEIEALAGQVETGQKKLWQDSFDFGKEVDSFNKAQAGFDKEVKSWDVEKAKYLSKVNEKNADAEAKLAEWVKQRDELEISKAWNVADRKKWESDKAVILGKVGKDYEALSEREAAVAAREAKADALAKLLKTV